MLRGGFKPTIPVLEVSNTRRALDGMAPVIGNIYIVHEFLFI
jgi:hypothetical protein